MTEKLISDGLALLDLDADGVGRLRLNRPEASNGMDVPFLRALLDAVMAAHGEPGCGSCCCPARARTSARAAT